MISLCTLGAVFLAVTGAEALYADLGHFGRLPIRIAWSASFCRRWRSTISGRARSSSPTRRRSRIRSFCSTPTGRASDGGAGGGRDRDREPGGDHRRLFADQPGDPARLVAAPGNPPHLGASGRPDLHAARERAAADRRAPPGGAVPLVERARLGLRHRRHRHHGGHRHDGIRGRLADVALVAYRRCGADCAVPVHRPDLSRRQHAQGRRRRLGAAGARRRADAGHVHVAARQPAPVREDPPPGNAARRPGAHPGEEAAARVPGTAVFLTGDPFSAPTALLHSLKHYKVLHEQNVIVTSRPRTRRASSGKRVRMEPVDRPSRACCCVSATWRRRTFPRRSASPASSACSSTSCRLVLSVPPHVAAGAALRHAALAGPPVHRARPHPPTTPPTTSRFRATAWSRSAPRLRSEAAAP